MARIKKNFRDEYIVVHHVRGEEAVLDFLRTTSHTVLDRLCFEAKQHGTSEFQFRDMTYVMTHDTDGTFVIEPLEETTATTG